MAVTRKLYLNVTEKDEWVGGQAPRGLLSLSKMNAVSSETFDRFLLHSGDFFRDVVLRQPHAIDTALLPCGYYSSIPIHC